MTDRSKRNLPLDLIRVLAFLSVVSGHFFKETGYYSLPMNNPPMFFWSMIRETNMLCIPIFIMLSGWLMKSRRPNVAHYIRLIPTFLIYVLISALTLFYRWHFVGEPFTLITGLLAILDFTAVPYAWYVEMYIGLFLLAPFLNILWANLDDRAKKILLAVLILMTSLPRAFLCVNLHILPSWWIAMYPVAYYFIGSWLREDMEEKPPKKAGLALLIFLAGVITSATMSFCFAGGGVFCWGEWQEFGMPQYLVASVCLFRLEYMLGGLIGGKGRAQEPVDIPGRFSLAGGFAWFLGKLSKYSFGAYLFSYLADHIFYYKLRIWEPVDTARLLWYPVAIPVIAAAALIASIPVTWLVHFLCKKRG